MPLYEDDPCPSARLLTGSYHCPCHGIHERAPKVKAKPAPRAPRPLAAKIPKPPRPRPLSSFDDQEACRQLYGEGVSIIDLASKFACGKARVRVVLGDLIRAPNQVSPEEKDEICRLYVAGVSVTELAQRFHRDRWVIYKALGKERTKPGEGKHHGQHCAGEFVAEDGLAHRCTITRNAHPTVPHSGRWRDRVDGGRYRLQWHD